MPTEEELTDILESMFVDLAAESAVPTEYELGDREYKRLPIDGNAVLERRGVKFLGPHPKHEKLQRVELPEGWQIKPDTSFRWCEVMPQQACAFHLLDENEQIVAFMLYVHIAPDEVLSATELVSWDD